MKRKISAILASVLVMAMLLSSCGAQKENIKDKANLGLPKKTDVLTEETYKKDYTDKNGRVTYSLDMVYPVLTMENRNLDALFNATVSFFVNKGKTDAESNIEYAAEFMDNHKSEEPWSRKLYYVTNFINDDYISVVMYEEFALMGTDKTPDCCSLTFNLHSGQRLSLNDFLVNGSIEDVQNAIIPVLKEDLLNNNLIPSDNGLNQMVSNIGESSVFSFSKKYAYFYLTLADEFSASGTFVLEIPLKDLSQYISVD